MNNWQQDPNLKNIPLGDGSTTIGASGCTVSAIGDAINVTADIVNKYLQMVGGFKGALVIWAKIAEAFPGITVYRYWTYNNDDVVAQLAKGNHVIVEVPAAPIGGNGSHWVEYIGNHNLKDPWTGKVRPTSDFPNPTGYCVISGTWQATVHPIPSTQGGGGMTDTDKAIGFDRGLIAAHNAGLIQTADSKEANPDTLATVITTLKTDRDHQAGNATKWDQACSSLGLNGDSSQITVQQVLDKLKPISRRAELEEIQKIVTKALS